MKVTYESFHSTTMIWGGLVSFVISAFSFWHWGIKPTPIFVAITLLALGVTESQRKIIVERLKRSGGDQTPVSADNPELLSILGAMLMSLASTVSASILFALLLLQIAY